MRIYACKYHNHSHNYTVCQCGHQFCGDIWKSCPRCCGTDPSNRVHTPETNMETVTQIAPSAWASYLINGDASGISDSDRKAADEFVEQWWNRDTGYGCCRSCIDWQLARGTSAEEIRDMYGVEGINYAAKGAA